MSERQYRDAYRQHLYNTVIVKRSRLLVRNQETRMWSLIAKQYIQSGSFIGFYTGSMESKTCPENSHYALQIGASQPCIVPFIDENQISPAERDMHPLAAMNEPTATRFANCHMVVQDFNANEIENVAAIPNHESARFYRCMACFACHDINAGDALTWNYGPTYEPIRKLIGYVAGQHCKKVLDGEVFVKDSSQSVLESLERVPHYVVFPVLKTQTIKSARFAKRHRHRVDSDGEQSESFSSGSQHDIEYVHRPTKRRQAGPL
jgi:hypothetical protein